MLGNWIIQTTTTTGTGDLALSATTGYPSLASQFAINEVIAYTILDDATGAPLERGLGYLSSGTTLVRAKPMSTMSGSTYNGIGPSALALPSGTKRVICAPAASTAISAAPGVWSATVKGYGDCSIAGSASSFVMSANRAWAVPFRAGVDSDIDALVINVTTPGAGVTAKVAIFSMGSDGLPGVQLAISGDLDLSTNGNKTGTFARFRPPPVFFGCIVSSGVATLSGYATGVASTNAMGFNNLLVPISFIQHDTTGTVFPTPWSTPVGQLSNAAKPILVARCVS